MSKLIEYKTHIMCDKCLLVLDKKLLPMANTEVPLAMVNYCMRCGCEFTEIETKD